jgi:predicted phosphodiesterase
MRVFAISDVHTDFKKNWSLIEQVPQTEHRNDVLVLAGDIADSLERIGATLSLLRSRFGRLFFVPGNHELWVRRTRLDSIEKLARVIELCDSLGVETRPARANGVWIVPLLSWYEPDFDSGAETAEQELERWGDFRFCRWPREVDNVASYFVRMNEPNIRAYSGRVISFSHFLPRRDLLPPVRHLRFKSLPAVAGSAALDEQIRRLRSTVHVFGHSHINYDCVIDGVRYVQNALAYPHQQKRAGFPVKLIWDPESTFDSLKQHPFRAPERAGRRL